MEIGLLQKEAEAIISKAGYLLVEWNLNRHKGDIKIQIVLYKEGGVGIQQCVEVHRLLAARLEMLADPDVELYFEVSSPGLTRTLKADHEYSIFAGRQVRILLIDENEWIKGKILRADDKNVVIDTGEGEETYSLALIRKAKLVIEKESR